MIQNFLCGIVVSSFVENYLKCQIHSTTNPHPLFNTPSGILVPYKSAHPFFLPKGVVGSLSLG